MANLETKVCVRCGKEYSNSIPPVVNPRGLVTEIATYLWCAECNRLAVMLVFRESSVYYDKHAITSRRGE